VKLLWRDADPIGRRVTLPLQSKTLAKEVVGIVGDVKQGELSEAAAATVYEYTRERSWTSLSLVVRTSVAPASLAQPALGVVRAIDPAQPVQDIRAMQEVLDETLTSQRFSALLLGLFASVALALATVGIYSVCRTSCAAAAARSGSGPPWERGRPTWSGSSSSRG
jgi:putative ABC transport system permease protein